MAHGAERARWGHTYAVTSWVYRGLTGRVLPERAVVPAIYHDDPLPPPKAPEQRATENRIGWELLNEHFVKVATAQQQRTVKG